MFSQHLVRKGFDFVPCFGSRQGRWAESIECHAGAGSLPFIQLGSGS